MSEWKQLVTSGSDASLNSMTASNSISLVSGIHDMCQILPQIANAGADIIFDGALGGRLYHTNDTNRSIKIKDHAVDGISIKSNSTSISLSDNLINLNGTRILTDSGNVGIGANPPVTRLHVAHGSAPIDIPVLGDPPSAASIGGTNFGTLFTTLDSGDGVIQQARTDGTGGAFDLLLQPKGGQVGIGTSSPADVLSISGGDLTTHFSGNDIEFTRPATSYIRQSGRGGEIRFTTVKANGTGTTNMTLDGPTGYVGIGTTAPGSKLHVYDNSGLSVPLVKFQHSDGVLSNNDTILDLDFDDDQSITANHFFIRFQNQDGVVGSINSEVQYSTFTGAHVSQRPSGSSFIDWKPGMIVKSTGEIISRGVGLDDSLSMAWPVVEISTTQKEKAVMGVFDSLSPAPIDYEAYTPSSKNVGRISGLNDNAPSINYNALGEGRILITDTNGDIEVGDYICTSTRLGHGEKQDDDLMHNYTVAKATQPCSFVSESIDSDLGFVSKLIACTYHCG